MRVRGNNWEDLCVNSIIGLPILDINTFERNRQNNGGPKPGKRVLNDIDEFIILELYCQGLSQRKIATRLNVSQWNVWNIIQGRPKRDRTPWQGN